jgi:hypothetical protein
MWRRRLCVAAAGIVACIIATAAVTKMLAFENFKQVIAVSQLVPRELAASVGFCILVLEVLTSGALALARFRRFGLMLSMGLFSLFCSYSVWRYLMNIPVPCSCFGTLFKLSPGATFLLDSLLLVACTVLLSIANGSGPSPKKGLVIQGDSP